jgi:hypothetical protein
MRRLAFRTPCRCLPSQPLLPWQEQVPFPRGCLACPVFLSRFTGVRAPANVNPGVRGRMNLHSAPNSLRVIIAVRPFLLGYVSSVPGYFCPWVFPWVFRATTADCCCFMSRVPGIFTGTRGPLFGRRLACRIVHPEAGSHRRWPGGEVTPKFKGVPDQATRGHVQGCAVATRFGSLQTRQVYTRLHMGMPFVNSRAHQPG